MREWSATPALLTVVIAVSLALNGSPAQAQDQTNGDSPELTTAVAPAWAELSASQQAVLKPFEAQWNTWTSDQKRIWVVLASRFPGFSARAKNRASLRIREWAQLSPDQRTTARRNYRLARERSKAERQAEWQQYQQMTPEQQAVLRTNGSEHRPAIAAPPPSGLARDTAKPLSILPVINPQSER